LLEILVIVILVYLLYDRCEIQPPRDR